jgi:hypothetical protein
VPTGQKNPAGQELLSISLAEVPSGQYFVALQRLQASFSLEAGNCSEEVPNFPAGQGKLCMLGVLSGQ